MRVAILSLSLAAALLSGGTQAGLSQPVSAYAWCGIYPDEIGGQNCYFASREQCMTTMSGIGGFCTQSLYYRPQPAPSGAAAYPLHRRHSAMRAVHGRHT
jgi:hypothetical protein